MKNLDFWNKLKCCPEEAKKEIKGGRLSGFTDVNPVWRMRIMTETFGMCGFGWKYEITKQWNEQYGDVVKTFCNINLYVKVDGEWSEPIPATGGSQFADKSHISDENHKMALTDALSVAMKSLGVAAEVYWDKARDWETKYSVPDEKPKAKATKKATAPATPTPVATPTDELTTAELFALAKDSVVQANTQEELLKIFKEFVSKNPALGGMLEFKNIFTNRKHQLGL